MDTLKISRFKLRNFKGIKETLVAPACKDLNVWADNGVGKTSLADSWFWTLFDKDSANRADFEIKTLDSGGEPVHKSEHSVAFELEWRGEKLVLEKTYLEKYVQTRGKAETEFSGHETRCKVNGVPVATGEYKKQIAAICDEATFRMLTDPIHFAQTMKWQDRRKTLLEVCGDISDLDVIKAHEELSELASILGSRKADDHIKVVLATKKEVNQEKKEIPARIQELRASIGYKGDASHVDVEIRNLTTQIAEQNERRSQVATGGEIARLKNRLIEIDGELMRIANEVRSGTDPARDEAIKKQREWKAEQADIESKIHRLKYQETELSQGIAAADRAMAGLRGRWKVINAERNETVATKCPACGQPLPEDKVAEATAAFNLQKATDLEEINSQGVQHKSRKVQMEKDLADVRRQMDALNESLEVLVLHLNALVIPAEKVADPLTDPRYTGKLMEKGATQEQLDGVVLNLAGAYEPIDAKLSELNASLALAQEVKAQASTNERSLNRIAELDNRDKELATEFERLDHEQFLCELFTRKKVSMLTDKINSFFEIARFRLFEEQINGGLSEVCDVTFNGVPCGSLNHGARLNVGLDCIETLARHLNFAPPIFLDNCESITKIRETTGQQIRLYVSEPDKELRFETRER